MDEVLFVAAIVLAIFGWSWTFEWTLRQIQKNIEE